MFAIIACSIFGGLLLIAAFCDLKTMEIPNRISVAMAIVFAPAALFSKMPVPDIAIHYAIGVAALLILAGMFYMGALGGGDAKLIAGAAIWFGPKTLNFLIAMALAGGVVALFFILLRRTPLRNQPMLKRSSAIPYAVPIAIGGLYSIKQLPLLALS